MQANDYFPSFPDDLEDSSSGLLYTPGFDSAFPLEQDQEGLQPLPLFNAPPPTNIAPNHSHTHASQMLYTIPAQPQNLPQTYQAAKAADFLAGDPVITIPTSPLPVSMSSLLQTTPVLSAKPRRRKEPIIEDVSAEDLKERKRKERQMRNREYAQVSREKKKQHISSMEHQNKELMEVVTDLEEQLTAARLEISSLRSEMATVSLSSTCLKCAGPLFGVTAATVAAAAGAGGVAGGGIVVTAANSSSNPNSNPNPNYNFNATNFNTTNTFNSNGNSSSFNSNANPVDDFLSVPDGGVSPATDTTDGSTSPIGSTSPSSPQYTSLGMPATLPPTQLLSGLSDEQMASIPSLSSFVGLRLPHGSMATFAQARPTGLFLFALVVTFGAFYTFSGLPMMTRSTGAPAGALNPTTIMFDAQAPLDHTFSNGGRVLLGVPTPESEAESGQRKYLLSNEAAHPVYERLKQLEQERALAVEKLRQVRLQLREERRDHNQLKDQIKELDFPVRSTAIHLPPPGGLDRDALAVEVAGVEKTPTRLRGSEGYRPARESQSEHFENHDQFNTPPHSEDQNDPFAVFAKLLLNSSFTLDLHTSYVLCPNAVFLAAPPLVPDTAPVRRALGSSEMEEEHIPSSKVVKVSRTDRDREREDPTWRFKNARTRPAKSEEDSDEPEPQEHPQSQSRPAPKQGDRLVIWLPSSALNATTPTKPTAQAGVSQIECSVTSIRPLWS